MQKGQLTMGLCAILLLAVLNCSCFGGDMFEPKASKEIHIESDTTWTKAESPYVWTKHVVVEPGVTLTIEPGVTVQFRNEIVNEAYTQYQRKLIIDGTLIAVGSENDQINFTFNIIPVGREHAPLELSHRFWGGLEFDAGSVNNKLQHCYFEKANEAVEVKTASISISNCRFINNNCGIKLTGGSIDLENNIFEHNICGIEVEDDSTINNNLINSNTGDGIKCLRYPSEGAKIINNTITNNKKNGIYSSASSVQRIVDNIIKENSEHGICLHWISNPEIYGNEISNNGINGIDLEGASASVHNNKIMYNGRYGLQCEEYIEILHIENGGTTTIAYECNISISNCRINQNLVGIFSENSTVCIHNSIIENNSNLAIINIGTITVDAINNWWGTVSESEILLMLQGRIDYIPLLDAPPKI